MPYTRWLGGEVTVARDMIAACKEICGEDVLLKVILETGRLREPVKIQAASRDVIAAGADFVKTSTGKVEVSATKSEEHTSELQSLMRISYAVFCLKKQIHALQNVHDTHPHTTI